MGLPHRKALTLLLCLSLSLTLICACSGGQPSRSPDDVQKDGVLRVAAANENDYPYLYWDETGKASGIEPEIARKLAESLGAEAEFIPYTPETVASVIENGEAELGIAGFAEGTSQGDCVETSGYYARRLFVLTRRDEPYPTESVMAGRVILSDYTCDFDFAGQTDIATAASRLIDKTADAVICDEYAALSAVNDHSEELQTEYYQNSYETVYVAVVAERNEKLYAQLNDELARLLESGTVQEIAALYP